MKNAHCSWLLGGCALLSLPSLAAAAPLEITATDSFEAGDSTEFSTVFGSTEIGTAPAGLSGQALAFQTGGTREAYDQILYSTYHQGHAARHVSASFRVLTQGLVGTNNRFAVVFDTPEVRNLVFTETGTLEVVNFGGSQAAIGSFTDDVALAVRIDIDLAANTFTIDVDGVQRYFDTVNTALAKSIQSVRFSHGAVSVTNGDPASITWLDDVQLTATDFVEVGPPQPVPLPAGLWLMGAALCAMGTCRWRA